MAMTHRNAGNTGEPTAMGSSEAAVRSAEEVPPGSAPFGASAAGTRRIEAEGGLKPG